MLASITPLGERGRAQRWGLTVAAFMLGATIAGAGAGAALGAAGKLLPRALGEDARLATLAGAALAALIIDVAARTPGPRRQVDERWRDRYRGWVYGAGYGAQLGLGVTTIVSSAATYVALLAALESAGLGSGAVIGGVFGALRGVQPLLGARVHAPVQLVALHARLARWRPPALAAQRVALAAIVGAAALGSVA